MKNIICFILFFSFLWGNSFWYEAMEKLDKAKSLSFSQEEFKKNKCLSGYLQGIIEKWQEIPSFYKEKLKSFFYRPTNPQSFWYQTKLPYKKSTLHFKFHYTLNGINAVPSEEYVEICMEAFEKSYEEIIGKMGYKPPLDDYMLEDNGGDEKHDVYFIAMDYGGFTSPDLIVSMQSISASVSPYFAITTLYYNFFGEMQGKEYLMATCAHEFFHGVQFAYNYFMPRWFMEGASTWIESIVYNGDEVGEPDAGYLYQPQLYWWFKYPDWSLELFDGLHEYGNVIFVLFLAEKFGKEIIKDLYQSMAEGVYIEMQNFIRYLNSKYQIDFSNMFKEFTLWNYFTDLNYQEKDIFFPYQYKNAKKHYYPPIKIHQEDIHQIYPLKVELDAQRMPDHLGSRYIIFEPAFNFSSMAIKVDGDDASDTELKDVEIYGLKGFGINLIKHKLTGEIEIENLALFNNTQEGQINIENPKEYKKIVMIISNLHPENDEGFFSYSVGEKPSGKLKNLILSSKKNKSDVFLNWEIENLKDIKEVLIIRKRYSSKNNDTDFNPIEEKEVYQPPLKNNLSDPAYKIIGKVPIDQTYFKDNTTFYDVDLDQDLSKVYYYYAIVPIDERGILGTPVCCLKNTLFLNLDEKEFPQATIITKEKEFNKFTVNILVSEPLRKIPQLAIKTPYEEFFIPLKEINKESFYGEFSLNYISSYKCNFKIKMQDRVGNYGEKIISGEIFTVEFKINQTIVSPNPFYLHKHKQIFFYFKEKISKLKIFNLNGELVCILNSTSNVFSWDGKNEAKKEVAEGVYLYYAYGENFKTKGKFVIIK